MPLSNRKTLEPVKTTPKGIRSDFDFSPPTLREVSLRVAAVGGINLGQGVCQTPSPNEVLRAAQEAIGEGLNRYAPAQGIPELIDLFKNKLAQFNNLHVRSEQILITAGATGAFESVIGAMLEPGDEVILFRPFYPYHRNAILRAKGVIRTCELHSPTWEFSREEFLAVLTPKTKLIVICTPNNPTGKVFTKSELEWLGSVARERGIWCVTDEVYEYLTYDGRQHVSLASLPDMADHTITMGSFSKTFSVTGWRVGYLVAPTAIIPALRTVSDQLYVCAPTPLQHAIARALKVLTPKYYDELRTMYQGKRDAMATALRDAGFEFSLPQGSYYILASTQTQFPDMTATEVLDKMISTIGVGAVPTIDFVGPDAVKRRENDYLLRFCYSIPDDVLRDAAARLSSLS